MIGKLVAGSFPPHDDEAIEYTDFIPQETMFWRRRAWDAVGGQFDESFRFALDWDIILRFRQAGLRFARLARLPQAAFRISAAQETNSWWLPVGRREVDRLLDRVLGYTPDLLDDPPPSSRLHAAALSLRQALSARAAPLRVGSSDRHGSASVFSTFNRASRLERLLAAIAAEMLRPSSRV